MTVEQNRDDHQYETPSQGAWQPIEIVPNDSGVLIHIYVINPWGWVLSIRHGFEWLTPHWMPLPAPPHSAPMTDDPITGTAVA